MQNFLNKRPVSAAEKARIKQKEEEALQKKLELN